MVELHEAPYELNITDQLEDLQETVGGMIEVIGNGDGTLLVCNEESKHRSTAWSAKTTALKHTPV